MASNFLAEGSSTVGVIEFEKDVLEETYDEYKKRVTDEAPVSVVFTKGSNMEVFVCAKDITAMIKTENTLRVFTPAIHLIYATKGEYEKLEKEAQKRATDRKRDASPKRNRNSVLE